MMNDPKGTQACQKIRPPAQLVKIHGLKPNKRLGQNFIVHMHVIEKIADALHPSKGDLIVEVASGPGSLAALLAEKGMEVIGVEKDEELVNIAKAEFPNVSWTNDDMRTWQPPAKKFKLVGNLPYYLTSFFIGRLLEWNFDLAVIMVQKEVGMRIAARCKDSDYSFLSLIVQARTKVEKLFTVGKNEFYPIPQVDSVVLRLTPEKNDWSKAAEDIAKAAFSHRRQTIFNSLRRKFGADAASKAMELAKIDPKARPQELAPANYIDLARNLAIDM